MSTIRLHHIIGVVVGALLGAGMAVLGGVFGYRLAFGEGVFWGAVIGGILAGVPQFAESGAVLTGSDNRTVNTLVGFVGGVVVLGLLVVLVALLVRLFS